MVSVELKAIPIAELTLDVIHSAAFLNETIISERL